MAFQSGYCTESYANSVNETTEWISSSPQQKEFAISIGRNYIDSKYTCVDSTTWDITDPTTIPEEVQWANAYLAEQYILGNLTTTSPQPNGNIVSQRVKAGSVESETTYQGERSSAQPKYVDPFPDITLMLQSYCSLGNNSKHLTRV